MSIRFRCPEGHKLSVADSLAGRKARCPLCRRKMYVPVDNDDPNQVAQAAEEELLAATAGMSNGEGSDETSTTLVVPTIDPSASVYAVEPADTVLEAVETAPPPAPEPPDVYRPDPGKLQTARLLAVGLALAALFTAGPVIWHANPLTAPDWVRLTLLICVLQLAFVAWMASLPDWASVWIAMLVNALVATLYGAALAIFLYSPADSPLALGLAAVNRRTAAGWCLCVVMITTMMAFACGRVCAQWRRADELRRRRALL